MALSERKLSESTNISRKALIFVRWRGIMKYRCNIAVVWQSPLSEPQVNFTESRPESICHRFVTVLPVFFRGMRKEKREDE